MPSKPWLPDQVVSADVAQAIIAEQFPNLFPIKIASFGSGWDNTAYLVNSRFVFRFPRRKISVELLEKEWRVLPAIASRLPLAIPNPEFVGRPTAQFNWPFVGYRLLPGYSACRANLNEQQRIEVAKPLGHFLRVLHSFGADAAPKIGVGLDTHMRTCPDKWVPQAHNYLMRLEDTRLIEDNLQPIRDQVIDGFAQLPITDVVTLVHGDLYVRHLLVNKSRTLSGVIDWGDTHIGDPAVDLMIAHSFLPPSAHAPFVAAYGPIDVATWKRARFHALLHASILTVYGNERGDSDLVREGLFALKRILSSCF
jgi:aminoglycoside phosphotransferase (APT) family kinase protein